MTRTRISADSIQLVNTNGSGGAVWHSSWDRFPAADRPDNSEQFLLWVEPAPPSARDGGA